MNAQMRTLALIAANKTRIERAAICREISSPLDAAEVIRTCRNGMKVTQVLDAIPRWGLNRVEAFLTECMIPYYATLGGERKGAMRPLTDRQRHELAEMLEAM